MPSDAGLDTLVGAAAAVRAGHVSPVELVEQSLRRIEALDPALNVFLEVCAERARAEAREAEAGVRRGRCGAPDLPPLHGVPLGIKDLQDTAGIPTTFGLAHFRDHVPEADALSVGRLRDAGAIVVGKTNTCAFGLLGETKNRLRPPCANPWDPGRTSGGSSGGSAVAVATGMVHGATGTDSAGSINVPAAYCGVYGIKPTTGRVPTWPVPPDSLLLHATGPLTRTVEDAALLLDAMSGHDSRDPVALREPPQDYAGAVRRLEEVDRPLAGVRVAYSETLAGCPVSSELRDATLAAARRCEGLGAEVEEVAPRVENPIELYAGLYLTDTRRAFDAHGAHAWIDELYPETLRELESLSPLSGEAYVGYLARLWRFRSAMADFFAKFDVLLIPPTAAEPFPHEQPPATIDGRAVPADWTGFMPMTPAWNMTGQPAASLPLQSSAAGLPLGVLAVGRHGGERLVLMFSRALELDGAWLGRAAPESLVESLKTHGTA